MHIKKSSGACNESDNSRNFLFIIILGKHTAYRVILKVVIGR